MVQINAGIYMNFKELRAKGARGEQLTPEEEMFLDTGKIYYNLDKAIIQTETLINLNKQHHAQHQTNQQ